MNKENIELDNVQKESVNFSVDGRLLAELGENLVTRNYLALAELIKNGYDADSDRVEVEFVNATKMGDSGIIVVRDYGSGMVWEDVREHWMRVATSNKEQNPTSKRFGRKKSGSKGIGRFACQKLAKILVLRTVAATDDPNIVQVSELTIKWEEFKKGDDLVNTYCDGRYFYTLKKNEILGTVLTLKQLKEEWNYSNYSVLQRNLTSLAIATPKRREGFEEDPGFEVFVSAAEFENTDYRLSEKILDASWGRVKGVIDEDGTVKLNFDGKLVGKREHVLHEKFPILKHAVIDIACMPERKAYQRNPQLMNMTQMKLIKTAHSGIKVYSEGFRVYPYGEPGDDWLGLDRDYARRKAKIDNEELAAIAASYGLDQGRTMLDLFRNDRLVGAVHVDTNINPAFSIKLNREGFVTNKASRMLKQVLRYIIEWLTVQYSYFKVIDKERELEHYHTVFDSLYKDDSDSSDAITGDKENYVDDNALAVEQSSSKSSPDNKADVTKSMPEFFNKAMDLLTKERKESIESAKQRPTEENKEKNKELQNESKLINVASKIIKAEYDATKNELSLLRAIASIGPVFFVFAHEFRSLVSSLDTDAGRIEQWINKNDSDDLDWLAKIASSMRETRDRFLSLENLVGVFASTHKTEKKRIKVATAVEKVCLGFEFVTSNSNININYSSIEEMLKTQKMADASFYSILVNLISNAIKAVLANGEREIKVTAVRKSRLIIRVEDKGIGLSKDKWEDVFLPLVTDPSGQMYKELFTNTGADELAVLGKGTGLGLNIVKGMVQDYSGTVMFTEPSEGWQTCVEVSLP